MSNQFASGKYTIAECDVCGFRYKLKQLKALVVKGETTKILACPACWVPDHPQLHLGRYPVYDPQAIRDPRPDRSYDQSRDIDWLPVDITRNYLRLENGEPIQLENGQALEAE